MKYYIVIDGGTTNTRLYLVRETSVDSEKLSLGSGNAGSRERLTVAVGEGLCALLERNGLTEQDVHCILASGTITSELGLCLVPHVPAPAGIAQLHENMHPTRLPEITSIPFVFIPGVRIASEDLLQADMMRGEETELFGLLETPETDCLYVLPGSHNKLITVDEAGRICAIRTMLTGEMLASLSRHTILSAAVDLSCDRICEDFLLQGYECCEQLGINEALFKVRMLKNIFGGSREEVYSFFLGVVLHGDLRQILACREKKIIIGGQSKMQKALAVLLEAKTSKPVICAREQQVQNSVIRGALRIYLYGCEGMQNGFCF